MADFEARAQAMMDQVSQASENRKAAEQAQRLVAKTRREFREEAAEAMAPPPALAGQARPPQANIEEGSRVRLKEVRKLPLFGVC